MIITGNLPRSKQKQGSKRCSYSLFSTLHHIVDIGLQSRFNIGIRHMIVYKSQCLLMQFVHALLSIFNATPAAL